MRTRCERTANSLERHIVCVSDRSLEAGLAILDEMSESSYETLGSVLPRAMDLLIGPSSYALLTLQDARLVVDPDLSRSLPQSDKLPHIESVSDELAARLLHGQRVLTVRSGEDLDALAGLCLLAVPVLGARKDRLIGVLLVQTMDATRLHAATERNLQHLARQLSQPLARQRIVVNFQRERHAPRTVQSTDDALAFEQSRS